MTSGDNAAAREAAMAEIVRAIQDAAGALEAKGRPGIEPHSGAVQAPWTISGWTVEFGRPDSAAPRPDLRLSKPDCRCPDRGSWYAGVFESGYVGDVILSEAAQIAKRTSAGFTDYTRDQWAWRIESPAEFAERVIADRAVWLCGCQADGREFWITERANPAEYGPYVREVARTVGDAFRATATKHLSRLDKTERNKQARAVAVAEMVTAIETAYAALERAGRPGLGPVRPHPRHRERIEGWRVPVEWAALTEPAPVVTPPPMRNQVGNWTLPEGDEHAQFGYVALTGDGMVAVSQGVAVDAWQRKSALEYANWMLLDWFTWWSSASQPTSFPMTDHTEADEYIPYVLGVARVITDAFSAIQPAASASPP